MTAKDLQQELVATGTEVLAKKGPARFYSVHHSHIQPRRKYLVGFEEGGFSMQAQNITKLEAIAHEEWSKIPRKCCQQLVFGCKSCLQQILAMKALNNFETTDKSFSVKFGETT